VVCSACRPAAHQAINRRKNAKRRGARIGAKFTLIEIAERDGWKCHLCSGRVDRRMAPTANRGPTIDHLVPISAGGMDEPSNVALAHRSCNVQRRDGGHAQLRLVA
jgi:5-methylcytosine-specific restriction endonuclease McrA